MKYAFKQTIPVLLGYIFLGIAYGLLLEKAGFGPIWAFVTSLIIYAGSMQFILVAFLTQGISLINAAITTLFVNGRHIFYGLSFIKKFKGMGKKYPYMVCSLTDETYSVLCSLKVPNELREENVSFWVSLFDHCYWVLGSTLGGIIGGLIHFDTTGIDFSMTALFVVIVVNQWTEQKEHRPAIIGLVAGLGCLFLLGADRFLLPAFCVAAVTLSFWKVPYKPERQED